MREDVEPFLCSKCKRRTVRRYEDGKYYCPECIYEAKIAPFREWWLNNLKKRQLKILEVLKDKFHGKEEEETKASED